MLVDITISAVITFSPVDAFWEDKIAGFITRWNSVISPFQLVVTQLSNLSHQNVRQKLRNTKEN